MGCDVINTSLGYSTFDDPKFNHTYEDFTGENLRISKAANMAVDKGMVVICSAGNSGNDSWGHIVAPSEAKKVISVAAVDINNNIASFSSRGFSGEEFISKPDISAMGVGVTYALTSGGFKTGNGTSFSSPIIAGMAACLVSLYPEKHPTEIIQTIKEIGNLYPEHSLEYGFGIPDFSLITKTLTSNNNISNNNLSSIYPNPFNGQITFSCEKLFNSISVYNINGSQVYSIQFQSPVNIFSTLELSFLDKGAYFAVIKGDEFHQSRKLIKY